jgi:hypothetical protein
MGDESTPADEPVTRGELERALRHVNLLVASLRDELLSLGAQVVTLTNQLSIKGVVEESEVMKAMPEVLESVRVIDEDADLRRIDIAPTNIDKYEIGELDIPCHELLELCEARCCRLNFALTTQDLNEGRIRWDYARPYWILQRAKDGYCAHNHPDTYRCDAYGQRPAPCRDFDCRSDPRVWLDYEKRIPAPASAIDDDKDDLMVNREISKEEREELSSAARQRRTALFFEENALEELYGKQDRDSRGED